jgi:hypothetical protein
MVIEALPSDSTLICNHLNCDLFVLGFAYQILKGGSYNFLRFFLLCHKAPCIDHYTSQNKDYGTTKAYTSLAISVAAFDNSRVC